MNSSGISAVQLFGIGRSRRAVVLVILLAATLAICAVIFVISHKTPKDENATGRSKHRDFLTQDYNRHLVRANQILVKFRTPDLTRKHAEDLVNEIRPGRWDVKPIGHNDAFCVRSLHNIKVTDLIETFRAPQFSEKVEYAEPDYVLNFENRPVNLPSDDLFGKQWALQNTGQFLGSDACIPESGTIGAGKPSADIKALDAWQITTGNAENIVVVLDTGIDFTHDDLKANIWKPGKQYTVSLREGDVTCGANTHGFNATTMDPQEQCVPTDVGMHGTHLAGIIGAQQNGAGIVGVNLNVQMMAVSAFSVCDAVRGLAFVVEAKKQFPNIRVVNNSYGWQDQDLGSADLKTLFAEFKTANDADLLLVCSAGDCKDDASCGDETKHFPSGFDLPNIISVTATDNTDTQVPFNFDLKSNKLLGAPGMQICSTIPGNRYAAMEGSSLATAFVSGAAALILSNRGSKCESLNALETKRALLWQADKVPTLAFRIPNGRRLNAFTAVQNCSQYLSP